jgi:uncharacterized protein involved in exopolysaccharide biosynthesis
MPDVLARNSLKVNEMNEFVPKPDPLIYLKNLSNTGKIKKSINLIRSSECALSEFAKFNIIATIHRAGHQVLLDHARWTTPNKFGTIENTMAAFYIKIILDIKKFT